MRAAAVEPDEQRGAVESGAQDALVDGMRVVRVRLRVVTGQSVDEDDEACESMCALCATLLLLCSAFLLIWP